MGLFSKQKKQKKLRSFEEINSESIVDDFSVVEKKICTDPICSMPGFRFALILLLETLPRLNLKLRKMERL